MQQRFPSLLFTMSLLSLLGCSPTTKELPATLAELRVKIEAEHYTDLSQQRNHSRRSIRVVLSNAKGSDIERGDVKIEVNGKPMRFGVGKGNYYDRHPYYLLDDDDNLPLTPGTEHRFVLVLPDGARHDIGTLRTPAALSPEQFDFPTQAPASGPVKIGWRDLAEPALLQLGRSEIRREAEGNVVVEGAGPHDPEAPRRTIGPGWFRNHSGHWAVPEKLLVSTADRKLLSLHARVVATSEGRMSPAFSKQSSMQATRLIQLEMEFAKVE